MAAALFLGCGSSAPAEGSALDQFPAAALMTLPSNSGKLSIEVRTAPQQPPSRGDGSVELVIRDATTGSLETGLSLSVTPWMPAMGHGASVPPSVAETTPGIYVVSNVSFFMPGTWELRTTISNALTDYVAPSFQIP
jgi:YtkA-like